MLLQRILQAQQNRDGGAAVAESGQYAQQLSELQNRVHELTEEVERLRANQATQPSAATPPAVAGTAKMEPAANSEKVERAVPKSEKDKA